MAVLGDALSDADQRSLPKGYFLNSPPVYSGDLDWASARLLRLQACDFDVGLVYHGASVLEEAREFGYQRVPLPGL